MGKCGPAQDARSPGEENPHTSSSYPRPAAAAVAG
jgi:hypothetical protein